MFASLRKVLTSSDSWAPSPDTVTRRRSKVISKWIQSKDESSLNLQKHEKSPTDEENIKHALLENEFLARFFIDDKDEKRLKYVIQSMFPREVKEKEKITVEGELGSQMFISDIGTFEISTKSEGKIEKFENRRVFGELALLYNATRLATITALTRGRIWVLEQEVFKKLIIQLNKNEEEEIISFLKTVEKLNSVSPEVLRRVANILKLETFRTGTEIVKEGEKGHKFYIIRAGSVTVKKEKEGIVNVLNQGEYFGVLALLKDDDTRQATVVANPPFVECLTLTGKLFRKHFGKVDDIADISLPPQPQISIRKNIEFTDIKFEDLNRKRIIGKGGFGTVELVQYNKNPKLTFALKSLIKIQIVKNKQQNNALDEKNILLSCSSQFIVRLYRTYRDNKYVYYLMELCLGGDLFNLVQRQPNRRFPDEKAKFIVACVVEAFDYLHQRNIVYKDLKPENLMIDVDGYIKLIDFGLAKRLSPMEKTYSFTGTHEYLAPEIILNRGHNRPVDFWTLGIFIFELLCARTPFYSRDPSIRKLHERILCGINRIDFPDSVSVSAKSIIRQLCNALPFERLGCQRSGMQDVRDHKWFENFDWEKLNNRAVVSPFKPTLLSNTDTRYFGKFEKDAYIPPDELSGWDKDF